MTQHAISLLAPVAQTTLPQKNGALAFDSMVSYLGGDIMAEYKNNRFVVEPQEFVNNKTTVVLCDIEYWNTHYEELKDWCDKHGCETQGMTVDIPNNRTLMMWMLRWS
jgi:hypothetical protein